MTLTFTDVIAIALAVIIIGAIVRFISRLLLNIFIVLVILVVVGYVIASKNGGSIVSKKNKTIVEQMYEKYCGKERDEVKCDCILQPLQAEIEATGVLEEIRSNQAKSLQLVIKCLKNRKIEIQQCLHDKNADNLWDEFILEIREFNPSSLQKTINTEP